MQPTPFRRSGPLAALGLILSLAAPALADRALVIGIDAYARDPGIPPLAGAVHDARAFAGWLTSDAGVPADRVRLLTDGQATRAAILAGIEDWLIRGTRPGERVYLYFSGHGSHVSGLLDPDDRDQVLVSVDTHFDPEGELREFVRDKDLAALLDRLRDRQVTVVVDACHSGDITRAVAPDLPGVQARTFPNPPRAGAPAAARSTRPPRPEDVLIESRPGLTVWTAASATQLAWETTRDRQPAGVFTTALLQGLAGAADADGDGVVTHLELHDWVTDRSAEVCDQIPRCWGLTPTLEVERVLQVAPVVGAAASTAPDSTADLAEAVLSPPAAANPLPSEADPEGAVRLRIESAGPLRTGTEVQFVVEADYDGVLTLLDINPQGEMVQLFPNRFSQAAAGVFGPGGDLIRAGRPVRLPDATYGFAFTVQPPLGSGTLVALVTADPVDLSDLVSVRRSLIPTPPDQSADWLLRLRERLRRPIVDAEGVEYLPRYAVGTLRYLTQ